jgi:hypothetical protein
MLPDDIEMKLWFSKGIALNPLKGIYTFYIIFSFIPRQDFIYSMKSNLEGGRSL